MRRPSSIRLRLAMLAFALLVAALAGCGGSSSSTIPVGGGASVTVDATSYSHDSVTIQAGESVTWTWAASGHTVTSIPLVTNCTPNGLFDSGVLSSGATYTHVFNTPGTYAYGCTANNDCSTLNQSALVVVQ